MKSREKIMRICVARKIKRDIIGVKTIQFERGGFYNDDY